MYIPPRICDNPRPHDPHVVYSDEVEIRDAQDNVLYVLESRLLGSCRGVRDHITVIEP